MTKLSHGDEKVKSFVSSFQPLLARKFVTVTKGLGVDELERLAPSRRIRYVRERHAASQEAFGLLLGTTRETVNRWENGQVPQKRFAEALAALDGLPHWLFQESDIAWIGRRIEAIDERLAAFENRIESRVHGQLTRQESLLGSLSDLAAKLVLIATAMGAVLDLPEDDAPAAGADDQP